MVAAVSYQPQTIAPAPIRRDTPERWARASERAQLANVLVTAIDDLGTYRVTSATYPGVSYESDGTFCTCTAAGHGDPVCLHRAAVRDYLAAQKPCVWCFDTGIYASASTNWDGVPCSCQHTPEPDPQAPTPSQIALTIARAHLAETNRLCSQQTDDDRTAIRRSLGLPDICTASPERIAELQRRLEDGLAAIGAAVRELEAEGYFDSAEKVSA